MNYVIIENGEVVNVAVSDEPLDANWVQSETARIGDLYDGQNFSRPPKEEPTEEDVKAERERRLAVGFDYTFADTRGTHRIGTTKADMDGWDEVSKAATAMIETGNPTGTIDIFTDTGPTQVTATEWQYILIAAKDFRQPIFAASFVLMSQNPISADYAADIHWP